jgi:hypothetical protein
MPLLEARRELRRIYLLLGSSLSRDAARRFLQRICHEALEDGIGDALLEAPQRFLTRFALRHLLAVVGSTPNVRPGAWQIATMCRALLRWRFPASESLWRTTSPLEVSTKARCRSRRQSGPWSGNAPRVADRPDDLCGQYGTYAEDLYEAGSGSFYLGFEVSSFRSAIFRSSVRMSRRTSEANRRRTQAEAPCGRMPRTMRAARLGGTSTTDSPAAANLPARCRPRPPAFSTAQRRSPKRFAQRPQKLSSLL